ATNPRGVTSDSAIWADVGVSYGIIETNLIYNLAQQGITDPNYRYSGQGIFLEDRTEGWIVRNNVIHDMGFGCITLSNIDGDRGPLVTDYNYAYNNTCYNFGTFGLYQPNG